MAIELILNIFPELCIKFVKVSAVVYLISFLKYIFLDLFALGV